ncbi:M20 family metallopeptidase [Lentilactobacillus raoultii]|uniref:M20 family metallopeptidase n=1 Tax=Lentilactobacillus raoultii TaxID=1987503 RepID=A0ABW3PMB6_9LACO|nr:amidohydrolase [Lentilactobacillus raoultii]
MEMSQANESLEDLMYKLLVNVHKHPELSGKETWTTQQIIKNLNDLNIPIKKYGLRTGVVAEIEGNSKLPIVALRADIDALPLQEESNLPYHSQIPGVDHACGHDFHLVSLLGAAKILQEEKNSLNGSVRLLFEPGEEKHFGAKQMIQAGVLQDVQAIFGIHNMPKIPVGTVAIKSGKLMASNDNFQIVIHGRGSHAAMPHTGQDPIVAAASIITSLQSIVSRNIDPAERLVITVGQISGGHTNNVIPDSCSFSGTIRAFSEISRQLAKKRLQEIAEQIALAYDEHADVIWDQGPTQVNNNVSITKRVYQEASKFMKVIPAEKTNADDDFASFEEHVPGCYVFVGSKGNSNLHHSDFIANPEGLKYAAQLHVRVAKRLLNDLSNGEKL